MTLEEFGPFLLTKSAGRTIVPDIDELAERTYWGLKRIATDTIPLRLVSQVPDGYKILRKVDSETYIRIPRKPVPADSEPLDMDSVLLDALSLFVLAGLETARAKVYMGMYYKEIDTYSDKLTETFLAEATNDSSKFHVFP